MKKQLTLMAAMFAMMFMLGMGANLEIVDVGKQPTAYSFNLIKTAHAMAPAPALAAETPAAEGLAEGLKLDMPKLPGMEDDPKEVLDTTLFLKALMESIGSFKGASTLMMVALVLQLLMLFFRTQLAAFAGKWKLLVVYGLSLFGGVLALKATVPGMEWLAAFLHSNSLAAMQVLAHQVKKQFWDKKDEAPISA